MNENILNQCIPILYKWISEYLKRHNLELVEIDYKKGIVFCFKISDNMFEDYFDFDYREVDLFK